MFFLRAGVVVYIIGLRQSGMGCHWIPDQVGNDKKEKRSRMTRNETGRGILVTMRLDFSKVKSFQSRRKPVQRYRQPNSDVFEDWRR